MVTSDELEHYFEKWKSSLHRGVNREGEYIEEVAISIFHTNLDI